MAALQVPPEIGALTRLEWLDLSECQLVSVPPEIGALVNLQRLDLHSNKLPTLPGSVGCAGLEGAQRWVEYQWVVQWGMVLQLLRAFACARRVLASGRSSNGASHKSGKAPAVGNATFHHEPKEPSAACSLLFSRARAHTHTFSLSAPLCTLAGRSLASTASPCTPTT